MGAPPFGPLVMSALAVQATILRGLVGVQMIEIELLNSILYSCRYPDGYVPISLEERVSPSQDML